MKISSSTKTGLLIGFLLLGVSPTALASGDIMIMYYAAGAGVLQLMLLVVTYVQWRGNRVVGVALYLAACAALWAIVLNAKAHSFPLVVAIALALSPWAICFVVRKSLSARTDNR